jgi:hypothetical protein
MTGLQLAAAFLVPWVSFGLLIHVLVFRRGQEHGALALSIAFAFPLSMFAMTASLAVGAAAGLSPGVAPGIALSFLVGVGAVLGAWMIGPPAVGPGTRVLIQAPPGLWYLSLSALLLLLLLLRFSSLFHEVVYLPTYPWDAWTTWVYRALVWFEQGDLVAFVGPEAWAAQASPEVRELAAWHYPRFVSLVAAWGLFAAGVHSDLAVGLPWLLCWVALLSGVYGGSVYLGASRLTGIVLAYAVGSLPMLSTHTALAGYADLWMATVLGLAVMGALLWWRTGNHRFAWVVLPLALALPLVKLEGMLWLLCLVPLALAGLAPGRWVAGAGVLGFAVLVWVSLGLDLYLSLPVTPGAMGLRDGLLHVPLVGTFAWETVPGAPGSVLRNLFLLPSWHLLAYVTVAAVLAGLWLARRDRQVRAILAVSLAALAMLYVIFFYSEAGAWVADSTAINRLLLHWSVVFVLLAWLVFDAMRNRLSPPGRFAHGEVVA